MYIALLQGARAIGNMILLSSAHFKVKAVKCFAKEKFSLSIIILLRDGTVFSICSDWVKLIQWFMSQVSKSYVWHYYNGYKDWKVKNVKSITMNNKNHYAEFMSKFYQSLVDVAYCLLQILWIYILTISLFEGIVPVSTGWS